MQSNAKSLLENELKSYLESKGEFTEYYPGMNVLSSALYKKQLQEASDTVEKASETTVSSFKMYLDTIIINMHTKVKKYKKSIYFDDENIKDIQNQGFTIPFYIDETKGIYVLLGIVSEEN